MSGLLRIRGRKKFRLDLNRWLTFLDKGLHTAPTRRLAEFMKGKRFIKEPQDVVFREKFSTVVNAAGKRLEDF